MQGTPSDPTDLPATAETVPPFQVPENDDASAWSNFVNYELPQTEDLNAWAGRSTYQLPQNMDLDSWSNHIGKWFLVAKDMIKKIAFH